MKKFSKFLHATAALRVDTNGGVDAALPHWYGAETADDRYDDETAAEVRTAAPIADHVCVAVDDEGCERRREPLAGLSGVAGVPYYPVPSPPSVLKSRDTPPPTPKPAVVARRRYVPVKVEPKTFLRTSAPCCSGCRCPS